MIYILVNEKHDQKWHDIKYDESRELFKMRRDW